MLRHVVVILLAVLAWYYGRDNTVSDILNESSLRNKEVHLYYDNNDDIYKQKLATNQYNKPFFYEKNRSQIGKENATILMLTRNWELPGVLSSMRSLEDRFNKDYRYTWTFLNDELFTEEFKRLTTLMASGKTEYGLIEPEIWNVPEWINKTKMEECFEEMVNNKVIYGHSLSYRNMCRFNSGYFFRQPLTLKYDYYFRVEPDVEYMCDFQMDPFEFMRSNNKLYGFITALYEYESTIPTLWPTVEEFIQKYPEYIHPNSAIDFITSTDWIGPSTKPHAEGGYNLCHFWSNFEIGNLNFFRSKAYLDFFKHLEDAGGFYYERWGDLPVHSILVSLLMDKSQIHHFDEIGYYHQPFVTCPTSKHVKQSKRCICKENAEDSLDTTPASCLSRWWKYGEGKKFLNEN